MISSLLANIYLYEVLDVWFEQIVQSWLRGRAWLIRYADDFVICFEREDDARRIWDVLPKRFAKHGLTLHPDKTRLLHYEKPDSKSDKRPTFDFLGFTHYWALSRSGHWVIKRRTIAKRLARKLHEIWLWCKTHRHDPLRLQWERLTSRLLGYYNYFGITCNLEALEQLFRGHYWLSRRSQRAHIPWEQFEELEQRLPLPRPRIVHSWV